MGFLGGLGKLTQLSACWWRAPLPESSREELISKDRSDGLREVCNTFFFNFLFLTVLQEALGTLYRSRGVGALLQSW